MGLSVGAGVVLISPKGNRLRYAIRLHFPASNNVAKYEGLINGLRIAIKLGATRLYVYDDSKLVVDQVMKESNCESPLKNTYCMEVCKLEDKF
jgi:ribonuclease HI